MILTVLDTETTGLRPSIHEILELAYISYEVYGPTVQDRKVIKQFNTKLKPINISLADPKALKVNHYSESDYIDAPWADDIIPSVYLDIQKTDIMIGHSLIFDLRFLEQKLRAINGDDWNPSFPPYIDTKAMADILRGNNLIKRSGMDYLCEHFNIEFQGKAHTALADCERTIKVFDKLINFTSYELFTFENPYDARFDR